MKKFIIISLITFCFLLFSEELPKPKNGRLYTEFASYRYAPYLKKPQVSTGYIAMDGENKLVFRQNEPVLVTVRKTGDKIVYQKGNANPIEISGGANEILIIFGGQGESPENYDVKKESIYGKDKFIVIPKKNNKIKSMIILAVNDILEKLEINFSDGSRLVYEFKNSITGVSPDEKFFE